ncbi:MAG TPA: isoamylase early set domain-containing protein [Gemmatimonadaceae bacterium]|nr:isoamylase early set domain-containing protein [Gemmatimonadaceae bacterium]
MTDSDQLHPYVEWIIREARRPVVSDPDARDRVMAAIHAEPEPRRQSVWQRILSPRVFSLSPVTGALLAAGLVGIGVIAGVFTSNRDGRPSVEQPPVAGVPGLPVSDTVVKFVISLPRAQQVSLVGDFNDWDVAKTPMIRSAHGGLWTVTVPLSAGRHVYAFLVDGSSWIADPSAPFAPDDGFGHANSVKIVGRGSSL